MPVDRGRTTDSEIAIVPYGEDRKPEIVDLLNLCLGRKLSLERRRGILVVEARTKPVRPLAVAAGRVRREARRRAGVHEVAARVQRSYLDGRQARRYGHPPRLPAAWDIHPAYDAGLPVRSRSGNSLSVQHAQQEQHARLPEAGLAGGRSAADLREAVETCRCRLAGPEMENLWRRGSGRGHVLSGSSRSPRLPCSTTKMPGRHSWRRNSRGRSGQRPAAWNSCGGDTVVTRRFDTSWRRFAGMARP